jgi:hypothetical protein
MRMVSLACVILGATASAHAATLYDFLGVCTPLFGDAKKVPVHFSLTAPSPVTVDTMSFPAELSRATSAIGFSSTPIQVHLRAALRAVESANRRLAKWNSVPLVIACRAQCQEEISVPIPARLMKIRAGFSRWHWRLKLDGPSSRRLFCRWVGR